jgi:hypothetical protein
MRRSLLLPLTAALAAVPGTALASPVEISPRASAVSGAGAATVEVANTTRHVLRGTAQVSAARRVLVSRSVRLAKRSVTGIALRFDAGDLSALRGAGGRATVTLRVRGHGGGRATARRTVRLRLPASAPTPAPPATSPGAGAGSAGAGSTPPASDRWVGRMGADGAYGELELTVTGGRLQITKPPLVPVSCFEVGGASRSALSLEPFLVPGPWTVGSDGLVAQQGISGNQLVSSGTRTINYKVTGTSVEPGRVTGTLGISFSDSRYDVFSNTITFINCAGAQSFEAVPAG